MNARTLVARGLRHYWRTHLGVVAGAAVGAAVLAGALAVGDSVRHHLRTLAEARLGKVGLAAASGDRLFRAALAGEVSEALGAPAAAVLQLPGIADDRDRRHRANQVQVVGVDAAFGRLAPDGVGPAFGGRTGVILNERLAEHLDVRPGQTILLRSDKPTGQPRDAPLSFAEATSAADNLDVLAVASDVQFGRFSLQADQVPPYTAFVPLAYLQRRLDLSGRANVLLIGGDANPAAAQGALRRAWRLADAQLVLRHLPARGVFELASDRVFLDDASVAAAVAEAAGGTGVLTYFVKAIRHGRRWTPYSMITAVGALPGPVGQSPTSAPAPPGGLLPSMMRNDEIVINRWLADDLNIAAPGAKVQLDYFILGPAGRFATPPPRTFTVRAIEPLAGDADDPDLMPALPGIAIEPDCRWTGDGTVDFRTIRPKDHQYWRDHKGAPKAFVTLAAGEAMWANRFGGLTAIRWPAAGRSRDQLAEAIRRGLDPAEASMTLQPVRRRARAAGDDAMDFGALFLGLSFFLIASATLLVGVLFALGIEQRTEEVGTLLALGFSAGKVRLLLLGEGAALAAIGTAAGLAGAVPYTRAILYALATVWRGAAPTTSIAIHVTAGSLAIAAAGSLASAAGAMLWVLHRQVRRSARELLAGESAQDAPLTVRTRRRPALWIALAATLGAVAAVAVAGAGRDAAAVSAFFAAGALLLVGGLALVRVLLAGRPSASRRAPRTVAGLGLRNLTRRPGRSLATVALLAVGCFLIVAVAANRQDPQRNAGRRDSGTGGFALIGLTALPVLDDLNSPQGQAALALAPRELAGVAFVPIRVRDGDDASCLNLNRPQRPRLLGVPTGPLRARGAFTFAKMLDGAAKDDPWSLLDAGAPDGAVPAVADEATITWSLKKRLGDTLEYTDEHGRPFRVRLVGAIAQSILQGSVLISEKQFLRRFPSAGGHRMFLIDAPPDRSAEVAETLTRALQDVGADLTPTARRLAEFGQVQNTYLSIFAVLGGLGLLVGSAGVGIVLMRNVLERRGELALLRAVGLPRGLLRRLVLVEHLALTLLGVAVGVAAGLVAVVPALRSAGSEVPYGLLAATLGAVALAGYVWTLLAAGAALRAPLLPALRSE